MFVPALLDLAHSEIAVHDVLPVLRGEVVELRILRRPKRNGCRKADCAGDSGDECLAQRRRAAENLHRSRFPVSRSPKCQRHLALVDVGEDLVGLDVLLRHRLHPHSLPDSGNARVEAARRIEALLAAGVDEVLGRIPYAHRELVFALLHIVCDVDRERILPALVRNVCHLGVSDEDHRAEVHSAEVEEYPLAWLRIAFDLACIPEKLVGLEEPPDAGKSALYRERDEYLAVPLLRASWRIRHARDGVVPFAVQVRPVRAHHLRTRIAPPRVLGRDLFAPRRHHRRSLRADREKRHTQRHSNVLHLQVSWIYVCADITQRRLF